MGDFINVYFEIHIKSRFHPEIVILFIVKYFHFNHVDSVKSLFDFFFFTLKMQVCLLCANVQNYWILFLERNYFIIKMKLILYCKKQKKYIFSLIGVLIR